MKKRKQQLVYCFCPVRTHKQDVAQVVVAFAKFFNIF
ncbi:hypothetical protein [uncultured Draconibacterium sp.]